MSETLYRKVGRRYVAAPDAVANPWGRQGLMIVAAHRYCLGRRTYIVGACADWIIEHWAIFEPKTRAIIQRDTEEEFARDDAQRAEGKSGWHSLGDDCDRRDWERVRKLWSDAPACEPDVMSREEIIRRLRWLAPHLRELGAAMEYVGGFGEIGDHGREMLTASRIAVEWADGIEEDAKVPT